MHIYLGNCSVSDSVRCWCSAQSWVDERQPRSSALDAHTNRHLSERRVVLDIGLVLPLYFPS